MKNLFISLMLSSALVSAPALGADMHSTHPKEYPKLTGIYISGEVVEGDFKKFKELADAVPKTGSALVFLDGIGGLIAPALRIGEMIRKRQFGTAVLYGDTCVSSCAMMWLAGTIRQLVSGSKIGFHSVYTKDDHQVDSVGNAIVGAYLTNLGLSYAAVRFCTQAAPDGMTWLTKKDATELGIEVQESLPTAETLAELPKPYDADNLTTIEPDNPKDKPEVKPESKQTPDQKLRPVQAVEGWTGVSILAATSSTKPESMDAAHIAVTFSDPVRRNGRLENRASVEQDYTAFHNKWPYRRYSLEQGTIPTIVCERQGTNFVEPLNRAVRADEILCTSTVKLIYDVRNNQKQIQGKATTTITLLIPVDSDGYVVFGGQQEAKIVNYSENVTERHISENKKNPSIEN
jgi:hypothetical protein